MLPLLQIIVLMLLIKRMNTSAKISERKKKTAARNAVKKGEKYTAVVRSDVLNADAYRIYMPINIGISEMPWSLVLTIPMYKISESPTNIIRFIVITGSISLIIIIFILLIFVHLIIVKPLARVITGLNEGAEQITFSSDQISSGSQSLAQGASQQAAFTQDTVSSIEDVSSMIKKMQTAPPSQIIL